MPAPYYYRNNAKQKAKPYPTAKEKNTTKNTLEKVLAFLINNASASTGCTAMEICEGTSLSRATVYRILSIHKEYGIFKVKGKAPAQYYCLVDEAAKSLQEVAEQEFYLKNISQTIKVPIVRSVNGHLEDASTLRLRKLAVAIDQAGTQENLEALERQITYAVGHREYSQLGLLGLALIVLSRKTMKEQLMIMEDILPAEFQPSDKAGDNDV